MVADAAARELEVAPAVSLINKMLLDLDRRNAMSSAGAPVPPQQVRAVRAAGAGHEWFWRIVAFLALIALSWVGWVAYQVKPRPLVTDLALSLGDEAQRKAAKPLVAKAPAPIPAAEPKPVAAPPASVAPTVAAPAQQPSAPPPELFRLALSIDRPITERSPKPPARAAPAPKVESKPATLGKVSRRERPSNAADEAEALFRHGVALLNQRRISEAQNDFSAALFRHPEHEASRQALIAIRIERRQLDEARRLLEEGLALNPAHTQFAAVLARIHVERGDYRAAADVLNAAGGASRDDSDFQVVRGAVLQRLGRHAEAAGAFEHAARIGSQSGATLVALGISLEATGRKADALKAYQRSLAAPMAQEARSYAESRIKALD